MLEAPANIGPEWLGGLQSLAAVVGIAKDSVYVQPRPQLIQPQNKATLGFRGAKGLAPSRGAGQHWSRAAWRATVPCSRRRNR
jgi:hypothetical protein